MTFEHSCEILKLWSNKGLLSIAVQVCFLGDLYQAKANGLSMVGNTKEEAINKLVTKMQTQVA